MLEPIPPRDGAAKRCADAVRRSILRGELAPGSRLPPERALAATLGVNRATVRTALRELEAGGLLHVRQGSGYAVKDFRAAGGPELVEPLVELARAGAGVSELVADVLVVRRCLARAVLERLAARPLRRADALAIRARIDAMEAAALASASPAALAAADLAILDALLEATKSAVLRLFSNPASHVVASIPELAAAMYRDPLDNVAAWRALVEALVAGKVHVEAVIAALAMRDAATVKALARRGARA